MDDLSEIESDVNDITAHEFDDSVDANTVQDKRPTLLGDIWSFMKERKKWWLLPIVIMLALIGILIVLGQSSSLSPFIYAFF